MKDSKLHVAVFPWVAFGHMIPFLELAKFIAGKGHKVTFISTPRNIQRLPQITPDVAPSITFLKLPLPEVDGLPENAEATMDVRTALQMSLLKKAYDGLQPELTRFLEETVPDWLIHDFAPYWLHPVTTKLSVSTAFFSIINAWTYSFFGPAEILIHGTDYRSRAEDFVVPPKWIPFESKLAFKLHEANWMVRAVQENESGASDGHRLGMICKNSDVIIMKHCYEFEGRWLDVLNQIYPRPVIAAGLMPPQVDDHNRSHENEAWLDGQQKGSVLYVALGSEISPTQKDITELALGLELSMVPFFWVLRDSSGLLELPEGFEERVTGRGVVWNKWAPQLKILSHDSVGGFLTHCGWGSCVEGLAFGLPLIMLPFVTDQGLNARILEDNEVGIEVPRDEQDGSYTRNSVAESVKRVMVEDEGQRFKDKAKEMKEVFGNKGLHDGYLEKVVEYLEEFHYQK